MEVDRIAGMNGVGQEGHPAWQRTAVRRRKFSEEVDEPQPEGPLPAEEEASDSASERQETQDAHPDPEPDPDPSGSGDADPGRSFSAIA